MNDTNIQRVLVTGGTGFLGGHLARTLLTGERDVRILARPAPGRDPKIGREGMDVVEGDIRDADAVSRAIEGMDAVIHVVSNFRQGGSDESVAHAVNVGGTRNVLESCQKHAVKHYIHCSTIGVHGDVREIPANEETPFNPTDLYQETKLEAEQLAWSFRRDTGLPLTVIRPISMFGPHDDRMLKLFRMIQKRRFIIFGKGEVLFHPSYVDDVVRGFLLCLGNPKAMGEAFIIGGEGYLTLNELCGLIAEELGVPPPGIHFPMAPMLVAATLCEKICAPLNIEPPLHRRRMSFFQNSRAFSIEKAKRVLGFEPRYSLREGLQATIAWYRDNGWL